VRAIVVSPRGVVASMASQRVRRKPVQLDA
jgi:hypothetical protein